MLQELKFVFSVALLPIAFAAPAVKEKTYDFIVIGGGLTGLVVANRLSENTAHSVLVVENGYIDDAVNVQVPGLATNPLYLKAMYNFTHAPDAGIGDATALVTIGNVVGGGSVVNGMAFDRASAADYDAWQQLGNKGWGWNDLLPYFKKSATFTPPSSAHAENFGITYDASYYGNGPIQASYPVFEYPDMKTIWDSYRTANVPLPKEHASGDAVGAYWIPTALRPKTQDRSHARNGYYDPIKARKNLNLLTGQHVDQILFDGLTAKGVEFTSHVDGIVTKAYAKREVILAAGAIFTPQLLQLSGIGPKSVLKAAGIKVKKDFAAIGQNLQDHPNANMFFGLSNQSIPNPLSLSDPAYNATAWSQYWSDRAGPYTQAHGSSLFFPSLQTITKDYKSIVASIRSQKATDFLPSVFSNAKLQRGFEAQRAVIADLLLSEKAAVGEIPMSAFGLVINALQRPLSRGSVTLNPANPKGDPIVQFNTFQNPVDKKILIEMMRWSRAHYAGEELAKFAPFELTPGAAAQTDEQIVDAMIQQNAWAASFAHMASTAAMMPENYGGVVSDKLLVYGTQRLSIVDASIIPLVPAAHLQATMYAIAEKAADLIKARNR